MKTNIFYAMNEIDDKYILEAAQCLEHKNTGRNYRLNRDKCLNNKWMTHIVAAILIIVFVFTTGSIINATTHGKIVQWITQLFGAEIVTRENRSLIGKEINDNSVPEVTYSGERCIKQIDKNPIDNSNIIKGVANENIVFALGVKLLVLILGATGYANMWAAVFADVGVSVIAILNAIRAMRVKKFLPPVH